MSLQDFDSKFADQLGLTAKRVAAEPVAVPDTSDPTFDLRRKQANLCEAVMHRVVEIEAEIKRLDEIAKKLRAAVVANT